MATEKVSFTNTYMFYFDNMPYQYPNNNNDSVSVGTIYNTGWHIIPNIMWRHLATPKQWTEFCINHEAYHVESIHATVFNPVPMTTQLAIQGTTAFTAFNNTIYSVGYTDTLYETNWFAWNEPNIDTLNLAYKEGLTILQGGTTKQRFKFPIYNWSVPNARASNSSVFGHQSTINARTVYPLTQNNVPSGVFWDPYNRPDHIMELRPGKNAMSYSWECHSCDSNVWFNIDQLAAWAPYASQFAWDPFLTGPPGTYKLSTAMDPETLANETTMSAQTPTMADYTIPNFASMPVVPMAWFWKEIRESLAHKGTSFDNMPQLQATGTEYMQYKYGPTQWFLKGLPLFDENNTHISTTTQACIKITLNIIAKQRRSAIFAPTWGPWSWKNLYSCTSWNRFYEPCFVRYRTGGARRTMAGLDKQAGWNPSGQQAPWQSYNREDPYLTTSTWSATGTFSTEPTTKQAQIDTSTKTTHSEK